MASESDAATMGSIYLMLRTLILLLSLPPLYLIPRTKSETQQPTLAPNLTLDHFSFSVNYFRYSCHIGLAIHYGLPDERNFEYHITL